MNQEERNAGSEQRDESRGHPYFKIARIIFWHNVPHDPNMRFDLYVFEFLSSFFAKEATTTRVMAFTRSTDNYRNYAPFDSVSERLRNGICVKICGSMRQSTVTGRARKLEGHFHSHIL